MWPLSAAQQSMRQHIATALLCTALAALTNVSAHSADFDELDPLEWPSTPSKSRPARQAPFLALGLAQQSHYWIEVFAIAYLVAFAVNFFIGRSANERTALAWAREFCSEGGLLPANFSLLGPGYSDNRQEILMKHSQSQFHLWASGRRYASRRCHRSLFLRTSSMSNTDGSCAGTAQACWCAWSYVRDMTSWNWDRTRCSQETT